MQIDEQRHGGVTVLRARGAIAGEDASDYATRLDRVAREALGRIVLDMSGVPYVDSAALESILGTGDVLAGMGRSIKLCCVNETLREVLDLTGVGSSVEQFESVPDAVRSFL